MTLDKDRDASTSAVIATLSHDLRSPLNVIIGFAELLHGGKAGPISDKQHEFLTDILVSSKHLLGLVERIVDLAKFDAGAIRLHPDTVDLAQLLNEVRGQLSDMSNAAQVRLDIDVDEAVARVVVDRVRFKQVLHNHLLSALTAYQEAGTLMIRGQRESGDGLRIDIDDNRTGATERSTGLTTLATALATTLTRVLGGRTELAATAQGRRVSIIFPGVGAPGR